MPGANGVGRDCVRARTCICAHIYIHAHSCTIASTCDNILPAKRGDQELSNGIKYIKIRPLLRNLETNTY